MLDWFGIPLLQSGDVWQSLNNYLPYMSKLSKIIAGVIATILIVGLLLVASADIGVGSWRLGVFDGDTYNNVSFEAHSTSTLELFGGNLTDGQQAWYWFSPAFNIINSFPPSTAHSGTHYEILPPSVDAADVGNLSNNYISTSTFSSLASTVSSLGTPFSFSTFMLQESTSTSLFLASASTTGFMTAGMVNKLTVMATTTGISYEGTTQRTNSFPIFKSATVGSGTAVFNLTADGTSGGTSLCPNGVIQDSVNTYVNDATASYQISYAFSNSNKTITLTANKLTTANILSGILGQAAANSSVIKLTVWCY